MYSMYRSMSADCRARSQMRGAAQLEPALNRHAARRSSACDTISPSTSCSEKFFHLDHDPRCDHSPPVTAAPDQKNGHQPAAPMAMARRRVRAGRR